MVDMIGILFQVNIDESTITIMVTGYWLLSRNKYSIIHFKWKHCFALSLTHSNDTLCIIFHYGEPIQRAHSEHWMLKIHQKVKKKIF